MNENEPSAASVVFGDRMAEVSWTDDNGCEVCFMMFIEQLDADTWRAFRKLDASDSLVAGSRYEAVLSWLVSREEHLKEELGQITFARRAVEEWKGRAI